MRTRAYWLLKFPPFPFNFVGVGPDTLYPRGSAQLCAADSTPQAYSHRFPVMIIVQ